MPSTLEPLINVMSQKLFECTDRLVPGNDAPIPGDRPPAVFASQTIKNVVTLYNTQTFQVLKVRVNRVITIGTLKEKVSGHFKTNWRNIELSMA
jgi:hypothetical protein